MDRLPLVLLFVSVALCYTPCIWRGIPGQCIAVANCTGRPIPNLCTAHGQCCLRRAIPFTRGTWLGYSQYTKTESDVLYAMVELQKRGVNRVYVDVWNQGIVYFPSPTFENIFGNGSTGRDILGWAVNAGRRLNMSVVPWFEYGFMASYKSTPSNQFTRYVSNQGWALGVWNNYLWMDPRKPAVVDFLVGIMADAIKLYPSVNMVQIDDHFGMPVSLGEVWSMVQKYHWLLRQ